jgi:hypothetical protein
MFTTKYEWIQISIILHMCSPSRCTSFSYVLYTAEYTNTAILQKITCNTYTKSAKKNSCMQIHDYVSVRNLVKKGSKFRAMSCILSSTEVCQFLMAQLISITCHIILSCLHGGSIHITNMSKTLKR